MMSKEVVSITNSSISTEDISKLVEQLSKLDSRVYLEFDNQRINARSLMGMILLSFKATYEQEITVVAEGGDEDQAIALVKGLFIK